MIKTFLTVRKLSSKLIWKVRQNFDEIFDQLKLQENETFP